jgi:hypothetical protein
MKLLYVALASLLIVGVTAGESVTVLNRWRADKL